MKKLYKVIPFVLGVFEDENKLLLGKHKDIPSKPYPHHWDFPGGKIKKNESPEECLVREMKEETGLKVVDFKLIKIFHNMTSDSDIFPGIAMIYKVRKYTGVFEPTEMDMMDYYDIKEVSKKQLTPWTKYYIEKVFL
jgi:8-oxo-dGTP diphosphatase